MSYPVISKGSKFGMHSIFPGQVIPLVRKARERGVVWPLVKGVDNGGVAIDVKQIEPRTLTITRFVNTAEDSAQDVDQWSLADMQRHASQALDSVRNRLNAQERAAADWIEPINEADPPGVAGWRAFGLYLCELVRGADQRGMKIALPAFNSGTPEWAETLALVESGVFGLMKAGGHILSVHEGVFGNDPVKKGFGDLIPGAPPVTDAGTLCFRYRYLYSLLKARGEVVPLVVSEFYGGNYTVPAEEQVARFEWYDREARKDPYVLAVLPFTIDPTDNWRNQDYTYAFPAVLDYLVQEKDGQNVTTLETAPDVRPVDSGPRPVVEPHPVQPPPRGTHRVTAAELNVRLHPWTGEAVPPKVGSLFEGDVVTVEGVYKTASAPLGWACVSPDGNQWVTMQWLAPL